MKKLPVEFTERMKNLLGDEFENFINAVNDTPVKGFRVNTDKISLEEFEKINVFGNEKIPYVPNGFYLDYEKAGNHPFHHAGMIYIQEPGAMAPAECIEPEEDWKILDMCAAPGGKSTQLKSKLGENGLLVSNEIIPSRCKILTGNIERLGLKNCITTCMDTSRLAKTFLEKHPEFEIVPVKKEVEENTSDGVFFGGCTCENIRFARRFYPHKSKGEGQFMAVLHNKNEGYENKKIPPKKQEKIDKTVFDFLDSTLVSYDKDMVTMYNGNPVYFTPDFEVKKGSAFSCGVTIGEIAKNYIKPHHQFFMAMGEFFKRKIELSPESEEIIKYLRGEEISVDCENGWAVVTVNGCSVGGAKVSGGKAKNHYPKGLRLL